MVTGFLLLALGEQRSHDESKRTWMGKGELDSIVICHDPLPEICGDEVFDHAASVTHGC